MDFFDEYFNGYKQHAFTPSAISLIKEFSALAKQVQAAGNKMIFAGNGASSSLSSHGAVDFTKQGKVRSITFHDPNLITCFSNDYGYDFWMQKALEYYADEGDVVVLISVSGESLSVVNAAKYARESNLTMVSFTGRSVENTLKSLSDIAFHVPCHAYNIVENIHGIWMTAAIDNLIGTSVYETQEILES
ncbi:MAG: SIS domain-containing protein [Kordiimonas sp.]